VTKPKPIDQLGGLVFGVGKIDVKGDAMVGDQAWYRSPVLLGVIALALCVALYLPFL
jgi:SSS family solute:Na+ symporter